MEINLKSYLAWRFVLISSEFLSDALRQRFHKFEASKNGLPKMHPRSYECLKQTMKLWVKFDFLRLFKMKANSFS